MQGGWGASLSLALCQVLPGNLPLLWAGICRLPVRPTWGSEGVGAWGVGSPTTLHSPVMRSGGQGAELPTGAPVSPLPLQTNLQRLMSSAEEPCRSLAFGLALRSIQNNPR